MAVVSETGDKWEIRRKFISPERALIAANQILWLATMDLPFTTIEKPVRRFNRTHGMTEVATGVHPPRPSARSVTLDYYPQYWQSLDELVALYELSKSETGDESGGFLGQIYTRGGQMGWHRDEAHRPFSADDSMSVNLLGVGRVSIRDTEGRKHSFVLPPGDAFYIDNSDMAHLRPLHKVTNIGEGHRVSFVD